MPTISTYELVTLTGEVGGWGPRVEDETRPGIDGHTLRNLGRRGNRFTLQSRSHFQSQEEAKQGVLNFEALQGTFVNIEDLAGQDFSYIFIHQVKSTPPKQMALSSDGNSFFIISTWEMQRTNG